MNELEKCLSHCAECGSWDIEYGEEIAQFKGLRVFKNAHYLCKTCGHIGREEYEVVYLGSA